MYRLLVPISSIFGGLLVVGVGDVPLPASRGRRFAVDLSRDRKDCHPDGVMSVVRSPLREQSQSPTGSGNRLVPYHCSVSREPVSPHPLC
jgi:hypothetical protein